MTFPNKSDDWREAYIIKSTIEGIGSTYNNLLHPIKL